MVPRPWPTNKRSSFEVSSSTAVSIAGRSYRASSSIAKFQKSDIDYCTEKMKFNVMATTFMVWVERSMFPAVSVSPEVPHPYIIPLISQDEPQ